MTAIETDTDAVIVTDYEWGARIEECGPGGNIGGYVLWVIVLGVTCLLKLPV